MIWLTTFNKKIWEVSGRHLIRSFLETETEGRLMVMCEDVWSRIDVDPRRVMRFDSFPAQHWTVEDNPHDSDLAHNFAVRIQEFVRMNAECIPPSLGGTSTKKMTYWNKNAARFYRKVAAVFGAWHYVKGLSDNPEVREKIRHLVWIDADVVFERRISREQVRSWFDQSGVVFLRGKRKSLEAGLVGFSFDVERINGLTRPRDISERVIQDWHNAYITGTFKQLPRWDDAWILDRIVTDPEYSPYCTDLAEGVGNFGEVFQHSNVAGYLTHNKGVHKRKVK